MSDRRRFGQGGEATRRVALSLGLLVAACGTGSGDPADDVAGSTAMTVTSSSALPATSTADQAVDRGSTTSDPGQACTTEGQATTSTRSTASSPTTAGPTSTEPAETTTTGAPTTAPATTADPGIAVSQQRLADLGYWLGPVDGQLGSMTAHAVTAFQKAEGLPRTGRLDDATVERFSVASRPEARSTSGHVLEIDLARQILLVSTGGAVERIYDIATGAQATPTPVGQFAITREIDGVRHAPLGTLYRPKYFNGGIALHGYTSVPPEPASHGCVRLTYAAMDHLWASGAAPVGTAVLVY